MDQKAVERISSALKSLGDVVRNISDEEITELLTLHDSGKNVVAEEILPADIFVNQGDAVRVLWALRDFKRVTKGIRSYE